MRLLLLLSTLAFGGDRPMLAPPADGQCATAQTIRAGESRPCVSTTLPPNYAAHLLADNLWLETSLSIETANGLSLQQQNEWLVKQSTCQSTCKTLLFASGTLIGSALTIGVLYAAAPALD